MSPETFRVYPVQTIVTTRYGIVHDKNACAVWNGERKSQGEADWEATGCALFSVSEGGIECL